MYRQFDLKMTLVLCTSKAQLIHMLLFAHKIRSCWCVQANLTLQNLLNFFQPPSPGIQRWGCRCAQEFSVKRVKGRRRDVKERPRATERDALKGEIICVKRRQMRDIERRLRGFKLQREQC